MTRVRGGPSAATTHSAVFNSSPVLPSPMAHKQSMPASANASSYRGDVSMVDDDTTLPVRYQDLRHRSPHSPFRHAATASAGGKEGGGKRTDAIRFEKGWDSEPDKNVWFRFLLVDMVSIDDAHGTFAARFYVESCWHEPNIRLTDAGRDRLDKEKKIRIEPDEFKQLEKEHGGLIWNPQMFFPDERSSTKDGSSDFEYFEIDSKNVKAAGGRIRMSWRKMSTFTFRHQFRVDSFPYDEHEVVVTMRSKAAEDPNSARKYVQFVPHPFDPTIGPRNPDDLTISHGLWECVPCFEKPPQAAQKPAAEDPGVVPKNPRAGDDACPDAAELEAHRGILLEKSQLLGGGDKAERAAAPPASSGFTYLTAGCRKLKGTGLRSSQDFLCPQLVVKVRRRSEWYKWNVFLPLTLITALGGTVWTAETCDISTRLPNGLLMVLTLITFKQSLAHLPQVSYMTFLDELFLFDLAWLCLTVAEVCVAYLHLGCFLDPETGERAPGDAEPQRRHGYSPLDTAAACAIAVSWVLGRGILFGWLSVRNPGAQQGASGDGRRWSPRRLLTPRGAVAAAVAATSAAAAFAYDVAEGGSAARHLCGRTGLLCHLVAAGGADGAATGGGGGGLWGRGAGSASHGERGGGACCASATCTASDAPCVGDDDDEDEIAVRFREEERAAKDEGAAAAGSARRRGYLRQQKTSPAKGGGGGARIGGGDEEEEEEAGAGVQTEVAASKKKERRGQKKKSSSSNTGAKTGGTGRSGKGGKRKT